LDLLHPDLEPTIAAKRAGDSQPLAPILRSLRNLAAIGLLRL
jgi:hypothetical protein